MSPTPVEGVSGVSGSSGLAGVTVPGSKSRMWSVPVLP